MVLGFWALGVGVYGFGFGVLGFQLKGCKGVYRDYKGVVEECRFWGLGVKHFEFSEFTKWSNGGWSHLGSPKYCNPRGLRYLIDMHMYNIDIQLWG